MIKNFLKYMGKKGRESILPHAIIADPPVLDENYCDDLRYGHIDDVSYVKNETGFLMLRLIFPAFLLSPGLFLIPDIFAGDDFSMRVVAGIIYAPFSLAGISKNVSEIFESTSVFVLSSFN